MANSQGKKLKMISRALLANFHLDTIDKNLIRLFMDENGIGFSKNEILNHFLRNVDEKDQEKIRGIVQKEKVDLDLESLIRMFELLIDPEYRKLNGAFYTPDFIVNYINNSVISSRNDARICDPACGSGAFLVNATRKISKITKRPVTEVIEKNIFGVDIDPRSVKRTKLLLTLLALQNKEDRKSIDFNIKVGDSLDPKAFKWRQEFSQVFYEKGGFDSVIGNPPYVRIQNLDLDVKNKIQETWQTASEGNIDLYIPFFELGVELLNENGILGYISPNTYFTSRAGRRLRDFLRKNSLIDNILDFNHIQVFQDVTTYTCITRLSKSKKKGFEYRRMHQPGEISDLSKISFSNLKYSDLASNRWNLLDDHDREIIQKIENAGTPLGHLARISVGLATLRDEIFILENPKKKGTYYVKQYKGKDFVIESNITKSIIKGNVIKSDKDVRRIRRRIIFPYRRTKKGPAIIPEETLGKRYPETYKYLRAVKKDLAKRDKGRKKYPAWYAYGRSQGLDTSFGQKILTPTMALWPTFVITRNRNATFYSGYGIYPNEGSPFYTRPEALANILNSDIMRFYIDKTSKVYQGNWKSYAKAFIHNFSIPNLTNEEISMLDQETDREKIEQFLKIKFFGEEMDL
jgi:type I restriction-modification system DNA methylase subunit